jgi:hypothetical protein
MVTYPVCLAQVSVARRCLMPDGCTLGYAVVRGNALHTKATSPCRNAEFHSVRLALRCEEDVGHERTRAMSAESAGR